MGLGSVGRGPGTVAFFRRYGAHIFVTDLKTKKELRSTLAKLPQNTQLILGRHRREDFTEADFILKNPAVPWDSPWLVLARKMGVPVLTDIQIFFLGLPIGVRVIGITGTKGKTTTARLIYTILKNRFRAHLAGVPGSSFLRILPKLKRGDVVVAELSSFDLEGLAAVAKSPHVSVITNIRPDHLNRYRNMRDYAASKSNIFRFQDASGIIFVNARDPISRRIIRNAPGRIEYFDGKDPTLNSYPMALAALPGEHNRSNIAAAVAVARFFGIAHDEISKALQNVRLPAGHIETILKWRNIVFINDTSATAPVATVASVLTIRQIYPHSRVAIILGGADKNLEFSELLPILRFVDYAAILPGTAFGKISGVLKRANFKMTHKARNLKDAIAKCVDFLASRGGRGVILFSPAAASFGMFKNEFDRGAKFNSAVASLAGRFK